jgi:hypothetical protein
MAEVLHKNLAKIEASDIHSRLGLQKGKYILLSAHREENIDTDKNFRSLFNALNTLAEKYDMPILYSCHPRSRKRLENSDIVLDKRIIMHEPLGFSDYNRLQMGAFAVVSDSGTLPEESSFYLSIGRPFPAVCIQHKAVFGGVLLHQGGNSLGGGGVVPASQERGTGANGLLGVSAAAVVGSQIDVATGTAVKEVGPALGVTRGYLGGAGKASAFGTHGHGRTAYGEPQRVRQTGIQFLFQIKHSGLRHVSSKILYTIFCIYARGLEKLLAFSAKLDTTFGGNAPKSNLRKIFPTRPWEKRDILYPSGSAAQGGTYA